jgi:hypothetical protein
MNWRKIRVKNNAASRGGGRGANSKLAILTFPTLAATVVRAFTNTRLGKVKFMYAIAHSAHHLHRPFRRHVAEIVAAYLKTALERPSRFRTREN